MAVARIDHPGLLATVDVAPGPAIVVTEHVTTTRLIDHPAPLWAWHEATRLMGEVAGAVGAAHAAGLSHGSLGRASVEVGPEDRVLVTDLVGRSDLPPGVDVTGLTHLLVHLVVGSDIGGPSVDIVENLAALGPPEDIVDFVLQSLSPGSQPADADEWRSRLAALPPWPDRVDDPDPVDFVRSERAWFIPALAVVVVAAIIAAVGLAAGRTDVGRRIFEEARGAVGFERPRTIPGLDLALGSDGGGATGTTATSATTGTGAAGIAGGSAVALPVAALLDFDPAGDGGEHPERLRSVNDGHSEDGWYTERYTSPDFGSLKPGVGLVVRLEAPTAVDRLVVGSPDSGWSMAVYASRDVPNDLADWGEPLAEVSDVHGDALVDLGGQVVATLLVWITDLGPDEGDGHQVTITRIEPLVATPG
jgi:hypothetical protein